MPRLRKHTGGLIKVNVEDNGNQDCPSWVKPPSGQHCKQWNFHFNKKDFMLIDIHVHCVREISLPYCFGEEPMIWPEKLLSLYDKAGIAMGVLLPCSIPDGMHFVQSNEDILDYAEAHPERFIPFCNLDPRLLFNDSEANFSWLMDYYKERGCKGIGELTAFPYRPGSETCFTPNAKACR